MQTVHEANRATNSYFSSSKTTRYRREHSLRQLFNYFESEQIEQARACLKRLCDVLPERSALHRNVVMVAFGGGKDSSYVVAFVRLIQLMLFSQRSDTFSMRLVTNRHVGMTPGVMANIHRAYVALGILDDPQVTALVIDGEQVRRFNEDLPLPAAVRDKNRTDVLMAGHRCHGSGRPTFCNTCNFSMVHAFALGAAEEGGADVIITGDSPREQRTYLAWIRAMARAQRLPQQHGYDSFDNVMAVMESLSKAYSGYLHGEAATPTVPRAAARTPQFFSVYHETAYSAHNHWLLLTEFLHFRFDDVEFSFSETDCSNPTLMAHLRGLKLEWLYARSYEEGIREYVEFGLSLMRKKDFPQLLIHEMELRYRDSAAIRQMRCRAEELAQEAFGLSELQLVCMIFSPFVSGGRHLAAYLQRAAPHLETRVDEIHALLAVAGAPDDRLAAELTELSGLNLPQLRQCYRQHAVGSDEAADASDMLVQILRRDPHKAVIKTRTAPQGPMVEELISGR